MLVRFQSKALERLYTEGKGKKDYPPEVVDLFVKRVRAIQGASDERDLRRMKSLHLEKLEGRSGEHSIRLNLSWRLTLQFETSADGKTVVIIELSNHYG